MSGICGEEGDDRYWAEDEVVDGRWVLQTSAPEVGSGWVNICHSHWPTHIQISSLPPASSLHSDHERFADNAFYQFPHCTVTMGRKYLQIRRAMRQTPKTRGAPNSATEAKPFGPTCLLLQRWEGFLRSASKDGAAADPCWLCPRSDSWLRMWLVHGKDLSKEFCRCFQSFTCSRASIQCS